MDSQERIVRTGACYDCGGRCPHLVHVRGNAIVRIESDDGDELQYRSCLRGRSLRQRVHSDDRLQYPLKRIGARGEGSFERISWDEALETVAGKLRQVKEEFGPQSTLFVSGTGSPGYLHSREIMERLLNLYGGCTVKWGTPSSEGSRFASRVMYGTLVTGTTRDDLVNSRLIILWGCNPMVSMHGTNTPFHLIRAKEAGAKIICIDPHYSEAAAAVGDQWIPIIPGSDTALMLALAYVMIRESIYDRKFIDTYTVGFDLFAQYVLGDEDGRPKTPQWAECITSVPAASIEMLAREFATTKPAALMPGFGPGRTAFGEQYHRAAITLAAMTGNVGISGGNAAGHGYTSGLSRLPIGKNLVEHGHDGLDGELNSGLKSKYRVHTARIWDALERGKSGGYPSDYKLLYVVASNCLNQHPNARRGVDALRKCDFIVVHEQFMTATARYADVVLPVNTHLERNDIFKPVYPGFYYIYGNKAIDALGESKSDYEIAMLLAGELGISDPGPKTEDEWLREIVKISPEFSEHIVSYDEFRAEGIVRDRRERPFISLSRHIEDPENNPFPTPSGKIEIFSARLAELNDPSLPSIPKYLVPWEGRGDPLAHKYPLQLVSPHARGRANSCFDNIPWLRELEPQHVLMNVADGQYRGLSDGDKVRIYNDRGETVVPVRLTWRMMAGVVTLTEGAWMELDESGTDVAGSANILTRDEPSPAGAFPYNTCLVEIAKC